MRFILLLLTFIICIRGAWASMNPEGVPPKVLEYIEKKGDPNYSIWEVTDSFSDVIDKNARVYLLRSKAEGALSHSYLLFDGRSVSVLNGLENLANAGRFLWPRYKTFSFTGEKASALASDIAKLVLVDSENAGVALDDMRLISITDFLDKHPNVSAPSVHQFRGAYKAPVFTPTPVGGTLQFMIFTMKGAVVRCDVDLEEGGDFIKKLRFRVVVPEGSLVYPYR